MKKLLIYLGIVVILFGALYVVNQQSKKVDDAKYADNPYGVAASKLNPATVALLNDPNYQDIILPKKLEEKIANKESFFVYYFKSDCSHCMITTPVIKPVEKEAGVTVHQFNLLEYDKGWQKYNIRVTPTLVYYKDGKEVERMEGGVPETPGGPGNTPATFKQFFEKYKS
ncbi:thioredoxin family protein [Paenibacillus eucommiae]|uniref:Thiol-disulfide isomerase/thioredoxin n=1 Tax=Paenibacillus eucommiae TaxID=1355755 RepID=A0ABS4INZ3_9BACL|nr:thioredoxin family protein [Paenibacillus eucommiae]MBP1989233.1 thiol-disulfide isomerase/thioredoxin [Paenibacillus eucommiae]